MSQNVEKELLATNIEVVVATLKVARLRFDHFNLDVAQFRADNGMSAEIAKLYGMMGAWDRNIVSLINDADSIAISYKWIIARAKKENTDLPVVDASEYHPDQDSDYFTDSYPNATG